LDLRSVYRDLAGRGYTPEQIGRITLPELDLAFNDRDVPRPWLVQFESFQAAIAYLKGTKKADAETRRSMG
jgi:hypothetical protein